MIAFEPKRLIFIHILFLFVGILPDNIFSRSPLFQSDNRRVGWIKIQSDFPIQKIWLDSVEVSIQNEYVKWIVGSHILHLRADNPEKWYIRDVVDTVEVLEKDTLHLTIFFPQYKMIYSDPYGAAVWSGEKIL